MRTFLELYRAAITENYASPTWKKLVGFYQQYYDEIVKGTRSDLTPDPPGFDPEVVKDYEAQLTAKMKEMKEFSDRNREKVERIMDAATPCFLCKKHGDVGNLVLKFVISSTRGIPQKVPMDVAAFLRFGQRQQWTHEPLPEMNAGFCIRCLCEKLQASIGEVEEVKEL